MKKETTTRNRTTIWLCVTAMFMAMNIALSSFGIPVPGGHLYLNDIIICTAAIILDPAAAFIVGGIGAFLGDLLFYPLPMFVSLVTHGLQAIIISVFSHYVMKKHPVLSSGIGVTIGAVIMVVGYSLGRAFIYSTPEPLITTPAGSRPSSAACSIARMWRWRIFGISSSRSWCWPHPSMY